MLTVSETQVSAYFREIAAQDRRQLLVQEGDLYYLLNKVLTKKLVGKYFVISLNLLGHCFAAIGRLEDC
jgi:hypothetical protein